MSEIAIRGEVLPELKSLADEANRHHEECERSYKTALEHAWHAGRALVEAKAQLEHGDWMPWVERHFNGSHDLANKYMKVAGADSERVRNLTDAGASLRSAIKELSSNGQPKQVNEDIHTYCPTCGHRVRKDQPLKPRRDT